MGSDIVMRIFLMLALSLICSPSFAHDEENEIINQCGSLYENVSNIEPRDGMLYETWIKSIVSEIEIYIICVEKVLNHNEDISKVWPTGSGTSCDNKEQTEPLANINGKDIYYLDDMPKEGCWADEREKTRCCAEKMGWSCSTAEYRINKKKG